MRRCTQDTASYIKYLVEVLGYTQTDAAIILKLNVGTVCHVVHGRRFPSARPVVPPWLVD